MKALDVDIQVRSGFREGKTLNNTIKSAQSNKLHNNEKTFKHCTSELYG
jgi:hypothetical protein